jgi:hypothetical protein
MRRRFRITCVAALGCLSACLDNTAPAPAANSKTPQPPAVSPTGGRMATPVQCEADVVSRSVRCGVPADFTRSLPAGVNAIVIGGQATYVQLTSANPTYNAGTGAFSMDVTLENLIPQALGTNDGTNPDAEGARVFFATAPVATIGLGAITIDNADGTATFTATNQPFYEYSGSLLGGDGILSPNETSQAKTWNLTVPNSVTRFTFTVYVNANVQFPNGYIDIGGAASQLLVGATSSPTATVRTALGDAVNAATVTWGSSQTGIATVDANGVITAVSPGSTTITATSGLRTGSLAVSVCPNLAVGGVYLTSGSGASSVCVGNGVSVEEFTATPVNTVSSGTVSLTAVGTGIQAVTGPPTPIIIPALNDRGAALGETLQLALLSGGTTDLEIDPLRKRRALPTARIHRLVWGSTRGERSRMTRDDQVALGVRPAGTAMMGITPGVPSVGDSMTLNVSQTCSGAADNRRGVVRSVSSKAVILADTANPPGGFTTAQYDSISLEIDSIAYQVDTANFGGPTDLDNNSRILLFFTRAVNELSPPASSAVTNGFFLSRDLFAAAPAGCTGSNEGEMLYSLVPDPTGAVNSNVRTVSFVRGSVIANVTHELQHLINASRRLYIVGTSTLEEAWLDEGLSSIAEELAFYRTSVGLAPAQNIIVTNLTTGPNASRRVAAYNTYANGNFGRLRSWLQRPDTSGIFRSSSTNLAGRGVLWAFLRYAVDRKGGTQENTWAALVNTSLTGRANLENALGGISLPLWLRDCIIGLYGDDAVAGIASEYTHQSWSYRSLFIALNGSYQLVPRNLTTGVGLTLSYKEGSTAYLRFGVPASAFATLALNSGGAAPPSTVHLAIMRTK